MFYITIYRLLYSIICQKRAVFVHSKICNYKCICCSSDRIAVNEYPTQWKNIVVESSSSNLQTDSGDIIGCSVKWLPTAIFRDKCRGDFNGIIVRNNSSRLEQPRNVMLNNFPRLIDRFGRRLAYFTFKSVWHAQDITYQYSTTQLEKGFYIYTGTTFFPVAIEFFLKSAFYINYLWHNNLPTPCKISFLRSICENTSFPFF